MVQRCRHILLLQSKLDAVKKKGFKIYTIFIYSGYILIYIYIYYIYIQVYINNIYLI